MKTLSHDLNSVRYLASLDDLKQDVLNSPKLNRIINIATRLTIFLQERLSKNYIVRCMVINDKNSHEAVIELSVSKGELDAAEIKAVLDEVFVN